MFLKTSSFRVVRQVVQYMGLRAEPSGHVDAGHSVSTIRGYTIDVSGRVLTWLSSIPVVTVREQAGGQDFEGPQRRFFRWFPMPFVVHARSPRTDRRFLNVLGARLRLQQERVYRRTIARLFGFHRALCPP